VMLWNKSTRQPSISNSIAVVTKNNGWKQLGMGCQSGRCLHVWAISLRNNERIMDHCEHGLSVTQDGMEVLPFRQQYVRLMARSKREAVKSRGIYVNTRVLF